MKTKGLRPLGDLDRILAIEVRVIVRHKFRDGFRVRDKRGK